MIQLVFPQGAETMIGYFSMLVGVNSICDWSPLLSQHGQQFDSQFKHKFNFDWFSVPPALNTCSHLFESDWPPLLLSTGGKQMGSQFEYYWPSPFPGGKQIDLQV